MSVTRLGLNVVRSSQMISQRSLGLSAVALQQKAALDPVQQIFVDKVREYATKKKATGGLVEATPAVDAELKFELNKIAKAYGGGEGVDMTKFPSFNFGEPQIEVPTLK
ncbi:ATP synthase-coupling factor 6, mitochondrial [Lepeophtheirus salmonis]|uniref:ATP synthase-coupling factor 6, mitochondrial n=1 Tax=Lepeophtheirus salmonis TaxID=72036 RepID=D3PIJ9_LEPSM|nr:ATP synthase-coupling factor 6, mitochondrial-like [Lepeophtheirus salmonis]ADD38385.1 ATP synthase-coupling factor 6, mitochondrial [Lepeophtheirus salmonis]